MNLSMFEDWIYSVLSRTSEGTSYHENVGEGTKNDSSYRTNQSENETETPKSMYVTKGRNKGIFSGVKKRASSSTRETRRNISSKKNGDQGVNDLQNSRHDSNLNTIQSWLRRFRKPEILPKLENSLEQLKRNKISQEDHEKLLKSIDKELQKLSITFHPDRAGDTEWQAALNAIREVLKTLTEVFLENIFIDYKYEYFSRLDVRVLVNENERNKTIQTIFYKISVFSETKRLNIIGEIRKFLTESEKCVKSFLIYRESDFLKFRDYALYHLRKNIEGYKKLERECNLLIEECSNEDDSMRTVVQNMVDQSLREWAFLRELEQVAKSSFQGNFEIFPVQNDMDEYYILPFVDYVNVLSMCNLLLQPRKSRFFSSLSKEVNFGTDERGNFLKAYCLAYDKETQSNPILKQELHKTLETIFREVLQTDYSVDVYREGKSNRAEMYEKLLSVKNMLKDLQEKEKAFGERVRKYEIDRNELPESAVNFRQNEKESFKVDMKRGEKEREGDSMKFSSTLESEENQYKIKRKKSSESVLNCRLEEIKSLKVEMINREKESEEKGKTFIEHLNQYKLGKKESSKSIVNYRQDKEVSFEIGMAEEREIEELKKINLLPEREKSKFKMERNELPESVVDCRQNEEESFKADMKKGEKESEEDSIKFTSTLEGDKNQCKMETKKSGESVLNYIQDEEKSFEKRDEDSVKLTSSLEGEENQNEMETKKFCELGLNCRQEEEENMTKREKERPQFIFGEKLHEDCEDETEGFEKSYVFVDEVGEDCLNQSD